MSKQLISFVIPVKTEINRKEHFEEWIKKSIHLPIEVILCNYSFSVASSSLNEIKELAKFHPNKIRIIEHNKENPGGARNIGLDYVSSPWVVFVDSDDIAYPEEYLKWAEADMNARKIHIGSYKVTEEKSFENKIVKTPKRSSTIYFHLLRGPGIWRFLFPTKYISGKHFPDLKMGEDIAFLISLGINGEQILTHKDICYDYRQHPEQLTKQQNRYLLSKQTMQYLYITRQDNITGISRILYLRIAISNLLHGEETAVKRVLQFLKFNLGVNMTSNRFIKRFASDV